MPRSSEPARRQILDAALQLFAANGIAAVSMREIRLAANQGNARALQYHFGSKDGLLRALLRQELPAIGARRSQLLAEATDGHTDARSLAAVYVVPFVEMSVGSVSQRRVVRFLSRFVDEPLSTTAAADSLELPSLEELADLMGETFTNEPNELMRRCLAPEHYAGFRIRLPIATHAFLHAAAVRAAAPRRQERLSDDQFRSTLVEMFVNALLPSGS